MTKVSHSWLRNLLIGREYIPSRRVFKYAYLRGQFGLIIIAIDVFYIILDFINGVNVFLPWYVVMALVAFVAILANRNRRYNAASAIILVLINLMVFLFADVDHPHGGVFFYFLPCAVVALVLLHDYNRFLGFAFASASAILGFLAYTTNWNLLPPPAYGPKMVQINFLANFTLGIFTSIFLVQFIIGRNDETEESLRESEKDLLKTSDELRKSEERYAMALQGSNAGVYEWNSQTNTIYVNEYWKELLGYGARDRLDVTLDFFLSMVHPNDLEQTTKVIEAHIATRLPYLVELRLRLKDGRYRWFQNTGTAKLDEKGNVERVIGSLVDIDERKKAAEEILNKNEQLAKTNEELDRFVYSASHDMRAPLSSLLGLINISEKTTDVAELRTYMIMMRERIKTMEGFIKEVTDYSRNARTALAIEKVALAALMRETAQNLAYLVDKPVRVEIKISDEFTVQTDINRLKVITNNLLANALKYHNLQQKDPRITIWCQQQNGMAQISIEDNGQGISPEHHEKIFDMFFRASENSEGSGLGLYIVRETLHKLGGTISVESTPGKGSTFTFTIPHS